ncbi:hypothetical protein [Nocardioides bruguierae]|uniref:hypothetical protein n=1 Tax=Nocardioides bruguierae TaxID=2945102 RepID=UPI0020225190|nr:hypothetical protein [Nocardioides bruguierae]MCL8026907.1 hypothetical protein [Nocardioides bruguierae]
MMNPRTLIPAVIGAVAFLMPAAAIAGGGNAGSFAHPFYNSDSSAKLAQGTWRFDCWAEANCDSPKIPGFYYYGKLKDSAADGDWVYTDGKIDGYGWAHSASAENHKGSDSPAISIAQKVSYSDPPGKGKIQVCRHRTGLIPNVCTASNWKYAD